MASLAYRPRIKTEHSVVGLSFFHGISEAWRDIPDVFASAGWARYSANLARHRPKSSFVKAAFRRLLRGGDVPGHLAIPLRVIREILAIADTASVLDVGGGCGDNYALLAPSLGIDANRLMWRIVENQSVVDLRSRFAGLKLATRIEEDHNLALVIGTLQYIQDWRGMLAEIASHGRPFIFIARSPLRRDGPSFLTMQSICPDGREIGEANVHVVGRGELEESMTRLGYRLRAERPGRDCAHDFACLPATYRNAAYFSSLWTPR